MKLIRRVRYWFNRERLRAELDEEVEFHRTMKHREMTRAGFSPNDAAAAVSRSMGNSLLAKEDAREVWIWPWFDRLSQDIRYSFRMFRKNPSFTVVAVVSLALGIGANSMVFSTINAILFKPLPVESPNRIVWLYGIQHGAPGPNQFSYPDYLDFKTQSGVFSDLFAYTDIAFRLFADGKPAIVWGAAATENFFSGIGLKAIIGRTFTADDGTAPGTLPVAVISEALWRRQFGADQSVIGKAIHLNGRAFTIVGVLPAAFSGVRAFGFIPDVWIPLSMDERLRQGMPDRSNDFLFVLGKLKSGIGIPQAEAAVQTVGERLNQEYRKPSDAITPRLINGSRKLNLYIERTGVVQLGSALTLVMVGFVLLMACANVANLILTRLSSRRREIAVRLAMGATRLRLIRQLLIESLLLSCIGGLVGFASTDWLKHATVALTIPRLDFEVVESAYTFSVDWRIIGFTAAITVFAGVICGVVPAFQASRSEINNALRGISTIARGTRFRNSLVVVQVALCIVLLVCAGLAVRSARNARHIDPGFATRDLFMMRVNLELQGYDQPRRKQFYREARQRIEALPGVVQSSIGFPLPLDAYDRSRTAVPEGFVPAPGTDRDFMIGYSDVAPGYFSTMQTRIVAGRDFDDRDSEGTGRVVIINQTMAKRFWPGGEALGKRIRLGLNDGTFATVVGIAQDGKYMTLGEGPQPYMYLCALQRFPDQATIVFRTNGTAADLTAAVREQIRAIDPTLAMLSVQTVDQYRDRLLGITDILAVFLASFGVVALVLAAIGLYGVISVSVGQRAKEIGIRMAVGAKRDDVIRMIMRQSGAVILGGCVIGLAGAMAFARMMQSILYGVGPSDSIAITTAVGLVLVIAALAAYVPARRAANVDPLETIRCE